MFDVTLNTLRTKPNRLMITDPRRQKGKTVRSWRLSRTNDVAEATIYRGCIFGSQIYYGALPHVDDITNTAAGAEKFWLASTVPFNRTTREAQEPA